MDLLQYEKEYRIHVYETGPDGKLNLCSLFNYMQDIASDHAVELGFGRDDLMRDNRFWVLSRMYAEINHWPLWGETIFLGIFSSCSLVNFPFWDRTSKLSLVQKSSNGRRLGFLMASTIL